jgi:hypothetical protein
MKRAFANLSLDIGLTTMMLALFSFRLTGLALHEWLGLALCIVVPTHLLVHWRWLAALTRRLLGPLPWRTRLTYALNTLLFVNVVAVTVSGLFISEAVLTGLPALVGNRAFWRVLHSGASNGTLVLVGLHLAVYAPRVMAAVRRLGWRCSSRRDPRHGQPIPVRAIASPRGR